MKPFLYQIAELFYAAYGAEVSQLTFVFPNRRAGLFFQKYLSGLSERPLFSPKIATIHDLFMQLSGKQAADRIRMLFKLYELYGKRSGSTESFDEFLYWGEMLLNDFDDVDKYMVDARMLFRNLSDLKELDEGLDFLSEEQVEAIRMFWSSFYPRHDTPNQQHFLELWEVLYDLYTGLRASLAAEGYGYEGMIFREVVEELERDGERELPFQQVVFVGLNALSVSEERLLLALQKRGVADFYWDYDSPFVRDKDNRASFFAERNLRLFSSRRELPKEEAVEPSIRVVGVPSGVGQAKQAYRELEQWTTQGAFDEESALRTAIVLPDEQLLVPVLRSIPESIQHINVTMGYPLSATPVASLVEQVLSLQRNVRYRDGQPMYYFRDVLPLLNHPYVMAARQERVAAWLRQITAENRIYIRPEEVADDDFLSVLFTPVQDTAAFSDYLIRILETLNRHLRRDDEEEDEAAQTARDVEQEFVFHYFATVNRMKEVMREAHVEMRIDTYFRLLKKMVELVTIPFEGEPLSGLQVMGVLETRALDFDRLVILSMNDGTFPAKRAANTFIPYNLRRGFGLPTYEHQDSIWAYHFYRLLRRAREVVLLYDTRSTGLQTGEVSRFVYQLRYHYRLPLSEQLVVYDVSSSAVPPIVVQKGEAVLRRLADFREGGGRGLSASAINTYLDCPLRFYFEYVEQIREEDEVSETIESNTFGSILHKVMEELYAPFRGRMVTADVLKQLRADRALLTGTIARAFAEVFFHTETVRALEGQNFLVGEMIRKYVERTLERDAALAPFRYVDSERAIQALFPLGSGARVQLKGFIDRIDAPASGLRIVDYKTGSGTLVFDTVASLFDRTLADRPKAVFQVFLYAWMYRRQPDYAGGSLQPAIYFTKALFQDPFEPAVQQHVARGKVERVADFSAYEAEFAEALRTCLDELFDPAVPFAQTETGKACGYCPFACLCGK